MTECSAETRGTQDVSFNFKPRDSATFAKETSNRQWLVNQVLVANQPGVIGGPKKSLKTSLAIDFAISLGSGASFLGKFTVPHPARVAVLSGESGADTIRDLAGRVCESKKIDLADCDVLWQTEGLPQLGNASDRLALQKGLAAQGVKLVIIDPLYLCLLGGARANASNLYEIGPLLLQATYACLNAGATPVFIHHATKSSARKGEDEVPDLEDLAFSGVGEFARQWLLLRRRDNYQPGTGEHKLTMAIGGSAGHSSHWSMNVKESMAGGMKRCWEVKVFKPGDAANLTNGQNEAAPAAYRQRIGRG